MVKAEFFLLKVGSKYVTSSQHWFTSRIRQEKEVSEIQVAKEETTMFLFIDSKLRYLDNLYKVALWQGKKGQNKKLFVF